MGFSEMVNFGLMIVKVTCRGTCAIQEKLTVQNWASDEFREFQEKRLKELPQNFSLHICRGLKTFRLRDIQIIQKTKTKGIIIVINRGTKSTRF